MHKTIKCSCGAIIAQCRCFSPNKTIEIKKSACERCRKKEK